MDLLLSGELGQERLAAAPVAHTWHFSAQWLSMSFWLPADVLASIAPLWFSVVSQPDWTPHVWLLWTGWDLFSRVSVREADGVCTCAEDGGRIQSWKSLGSCFLGFLFKHSSFKFYCNLQINHICPSWNSLAWADQLYMDIKKVCSYI